MALCKLIYKIGNIMKIEGFKEDIFKTIFKTIIADSLLFFENIEKLYVYI